MSSTFKYNLSNPENLKSEYKSFDQIDFLISGQDKLVGGSVKLVFDVAVQNNDTTKYIFYDELCGTHCFIESISTSTQNFGQLEFIGEYPRYQSAKNQASLNKSLDLHSSQYVCENRCSHKELTNMLLKGVCDRQASVGAVDPDFTLPLDSTLKLDFCLNNIQGDTNLPLQKTGDIRITITCARDISVLYGDASIATSSVYSLTNVRLFYMTIPDNGKYSQSYPMKTVATLRQTISSSFSNISTKVPIVANSMYMTFIRNEDESNPLTNGLENQVIPFVSKVDFLWNDSFSNAITYTLDNRQDILYNYIKAVNTMTPNNNATLSNLANNNGYGMGTTFGAYIDLSKQKIGVNIQSEVSSSHPYSVYMFFNGLVQL
jgi:hypothetical protein